MDIAIKLTRASSESANNIYEELADHHLATLATVGADGLPHLTVVYYTIDEAFAMHFATKTETLKHLNIQKNNNVMLLVFDEGKQMTIQIKGIAKEIKSGSHKSKVIENMYQTARDNSYDKSETPPLSKLYAGDYVTYEVAPIQIRMGFFIRPQVGGYDMYEKLEFKKTKIVDGKGEQS